VKAERLAFADALRVAVIVFVIVHHAARAYGPTGGEWTIHHPTVIEGLRAFFVVNVSFGLGLLFLLAGYFVPGSYERKGARRFLKERLARIGVPLAVFTLGVHLPVVYLSRSRPPIGEFVHWLYQSGWLPLYWHLWFLGHLLLYSAAYAAWRWTAPRQRPSKPLPLPGHASILGFAAVLALVIFVVRLRYPVDRWVPLFWVLAAEPAHLPQYVSLFAVGALAARGDWLRRLPTRVGLTWLFAGLLAAAGAYVLSALGPWDALMAGGGPTLSSLARSAWEALLSVGLSVGLIVLLRELVRRPHRLVDGMARDSYPAYMLHIPVVVGLQAGAEGLDLPVGVLFALVAVAAVLLAFGIGHVAGKTPGLRVILGTGPHRIRSEYEQSER
jgi:peptidoglycan/LPS O-acetylase OafA/YrhL